MAFAPREPYFNYTCNACGWSVTISQRSDALIRGPSECEKCGSKSFTLKTSKFPGIGFIANTIFDRKP